ncbi:MAG: hypothetical protein KC503_09270 [Myxococcales bacterium]|nr:hypothetical protein [Myxococcales bacterium]
MAELDQSEIESTVVDFHHKLDRLRMLYEQYFLGIEKREPQMQRQEVVRLMRLLESTPIRNTGLKFRFRTLMQKYNSYRTYWNRTLRQIEKGTYHRDVARLKRRLADKGIALPAKGKQLNEVQLEKALREAADQDKEIKRRSASDLRGRPAEQLRDPYGHNQQAPMHLDDSGGLQPEAAPAATNWDPDDQTNPSAPRAWPEAPAQGRPRPSRPPQQQRQYAGYDAPTSDGFYGDDYGYAQQGQPPPPPAAAYDDSHDLPSAPRVRARVSAPPPEHMRRPPPRPARSRPAPSPSAGSDGSLPEPQMRSLYRRLIKAKKICGEDASSVRYDALVKTINRQLPKLKQMHAGRDVEFQVVIRDGRAILKAKPK